MRENKESKMHSFFNILEDFLVRYMAYFNYKKYIRNINLHKNEKVLEIGCGGGNLSRFLAEQLPYGKLVCVDISKYWVKKAKSRLKKFRNIRFKVKDILDFKTKECYDTIILHYILHDINKYKRLELIKKLKLMLKDDGRIYIRELTTKEHGISVKKIENLMLSSGFKKISSKEIYSLLLKHYYVGIFKRGNL